MLSNEVYQLVLFFLEPKVLVLYPHTHCDTPRRSIYYYTGKYLLRLYFWIRYCESEKSSCTDKIPFAYHKWSATHLSRWSCASRGPHGSRSWRTPQSRASARPAGSRSAWLEKVEYRELLACIFQILKWGKENALSIKIKYWLYTTFNVFAKWPFTITFMVPTKCGLVCYTYEVPSNMSTKAWTMFFIQFFLTWSK